MAKKPKLPDEQEARQLVQDHLSFVRDVAQIFLSRRSNLGIDRQDMVQAGVLGLIDAARRFDKSRGIKFETFAERRIRGAMLDALRKEAWPRGMRALRRNIERVREKKLLETGREPSFTELAEHLGKSEIRLLEEMKCIRIAEAMVVSPSPEKAIDPALLPEALSPRPSRIPETMLLRKEQRQRVRAAIAALPHREKRLVYYHYFLELRLGDIAELLGISETRASQHKMRALVFLQRSLLGPAQTEKRRKPKPTRFNPTEQLSKKRIEAVLGRHNYSVVSAAPELGLSDTALADLIIRLKIDVPLTAV